MDIRMPGRDGIEATRDIVAAGLPSRVLILTTFDLDDYVYAGLRAGASGRILAKLGLRDRVQAVVLAYESRLITPGTPPPPSPDRRHM
jgi:DNA-binding NarL/FixJ family response regulator